MIFFFVHCFFFFAFFYLFNEIKWFLNFHSWTEEEKSKKNYYTHSFDSVHIRTFSSVFFLVFNCHCVYPSSIVLRPPSIRVCVYIFQSHLSIKKNIFFLSFLLFVRSYSSFIWMAALRSFWWIVDVLRALEHPLCLWLYSLTFILAYYINFRKFYFR